MDMEANHAELANELSLLKKDMEYIRSILGEIREDLRGNKFASAERVQRLEAIVYGGVGLILIGVVLAGLSLVIK